MLDPFVSHRRLGSKKKSMSEKLVWYNYISAIGTPLLTFLLFYICMKIIYEVRIKVEIEWQFLMEGP